MSVDKGIRVNRSAVEFDLEVQMRPSGVPGVSHGSNHLSAADVLTGAYIQRRAMHVYGYDSIAVDNHDPVACSALITSDGNSPAFCCIDWSPIGSGQIQSLVKSIVTPTKP